MQKSVCISIWTKLKKIDYGADLPFVVLWGPIVVKRRRPSKTEHMLLVLAINREPRVACMRVTKLLFNQRNNSPTPVERLAHIEVGIGHKAACHLKKQSLDQDSHRYQNTTHHKYSTHPLRECKDSYEEQTWFMNSSLSMLPLSTRKQGKFVIKPQKKNQQ